jgi:hypothetical protein
MVEPALVAVSILAASVLVAVLLGLLLSRGAERLFRLGRRVSPSDETEAETDEPDAPDAPGAPGAETDEAPAETHGA